MPLFFVFRITALTDAITTFDVVVDAIFIFGIVLRFFIAYPHKVTDKLVVSHKRIAWNYLTGWFIFDVLAVFPLYLIFTAASPIRFTLLIRVPRLVKCVAFRRCSLEHAYARSRARIT